MGPPNSDALGANGRRREAPKNKTSLHDDLECARTYNIANSQAQHNRTQSQAQHNRTQSRARQETQHRRAAAGAPREPF